MFNVTIGQYYPTDSIIHRLDPRTKINATLLFIIFLFVVNNFVGYFLAFLMLAAVIAMTKIPVKLFLKGLKALFFIIVLTVVINSCLTPGNVVFSIWFIKFTDAGIKMAVKMGVRLIMLVSGTSVMTLATSTIALTDGLEYLFGKVPFVKKYSHELSMMMSIALRFIPTFAEETERIIKAQKSRGADFESGNIIKRAKSLIPILVPLFVSAFQRASDLAMAMESRCYRGGEGRTRLKELKYTKRDTAAYVIVWVCAAILVGSRFIDLAALGIVL